MSNYKDIGHSGLETRFGRPNDDFLVEWQGPEKVKRVTEMVKNSAIVGALRLAIEMPIRNIDWVFASDAGENDPRLELLEAARENLTTSWNDHITAALLFPFYGWSMFTLTYERVGGRVLWRKFKELGQETVYEWSYDPDGGLAGLKQLPWLTPEIIPIERMIIYRFRYNRNHPEGEALAPETPVPTPDGWRTMGDLREGDRVFDETGRIRHVVASKAWFNRPRYRVTFTGGSSIIADVNHKWLTQKLSERSRGLPGKIRTTGEIAEWVKTGWNVSNYSVPWAAPLQYVRQHQPIDPYYLGLWLGDGNSNTSQVYAHIQDVPEEVAAIEALGYQTSVASNGGNARTIRIYGEAGRWDSSGPLTMLRSLGVLGNKHIPNSYLYGDIEQRKALLAGLMDSDGHVDHMGRCEFSNTNPTLIRGVAELVRSLGVGVTVYDKENRAGSCWSVVRFTPPWSPFRLDRKSARTINARARTNHYIVSVEEVEPGDTVCIQVDSPSNLYLAGEAMVPTHNSILRPAWLSYYYAKNLQQVEAISIERNLNGLPVITPPQGADMSETSAETSDYGRAHAIVRNIRNDEQAGVVLPPPSGDGDHLKWHLDLMSSQGSSKVMDTDAVIVRYEKRILMSALSQFLILGQDGIGSLSLSNDQTALFSTALGSVADIIAETFTKFAIPRLMKLNGLDAEGLRLEHSRVMINPTMMLESLMSMMPQLTWDAEDEVWLRSIYGLPERDVDELTAARADEQARKAAALRPAFGGFGQNGSGPSNGAAPVDRNAADFYASGAAPDDDERRKDEARMERTVRGYFAELRQKVEKWAKRQSR